VLAALAHPPDPALDELLGAQAAQIIRAEVQRAVCAWAARVAPDRAYEATTAAAAAAALEGHEGPVLFVAGDVPEIRDSAASGALEDLRAGAEVVVGPTNDGTPYLLALPDAAPERLVLLDASRDELFAAAAAMAGGIGMLRSERRLVTPADARALAADPALPLELALPLAAGLDVRSRRTAGR
jgi:hypothetical protein